MRKYIISDKKLKKNLKKGASKDAIEQSYKKLAFKWHPEKYSTTKNTQEALKVFHSSIYFFFIKLNKPFNLCLIK